MYVKIFSQIYDGTLVTRGPWQALVTFQQLLILADQDGNVDMTDEAISRRTTIPLDIIQIGIAGLLKPDDKSRTPTEDGRRILPLAEHRDWGWHIVNYEHYRRMKREEDRREYHQTYYHEKRKKQKPVEKQEFNTFQHFQQIQQIQPIAEAEAYAKVVNPAAAKAARNPPIDPVKDEIWKTGRQILAEQGSSRDAAGSFLGKLCKDFGQLLVLDAVRDCAATTPAEAKAWLVARCQERRELAGNKSSAIEARNRAAVQQALKEVNHG